MEPIGGASRLTKPPPNRKSPAQVNLRKEFMNHSLFDVYFHQFLRWKSKLMDFRSFVFLKLQEWHRPVSLFPSFASINMEEIQRRMKERQEELKKKVSQVDIKELIQHRY